MDWREEIKLKQKAQEYYEKEFSYNQVYIQGYSDGYIKAIDEFVERLKSDEFQKYNLDMVFETSRDLSYSHCINAFHEYVDEMAEQMKAGGENV